jgi:hypothetical protein
MLCDENINQPTKECIMEKMQTVIRMFSLALLISVFLIASSLQAVQPEAFDAQKVRQLSGGDKKNRSDVEKLFGKPVSTAPIKKSGEGCVELWIYSDVIMDGYTPVKTELMYIGIDEKGLVCSVEVEHVKIE